MHDRGNSYCFNWFGSAEQLFCERSCKGASQSLGGGAYGSGCRLCGSLGCFVQSWYVSLHGVES